VRQASEHAGDGVVGVAGASVVQQCLNAGVLDAVRVSVVPYLIGGDSVLRGAGDDSDQARAAEGGGGRGVTHLYYEVER
jgi:dihydrofolate reductase